MIDSAHALAKTLVTNFVTNGTVVATAESCTGGLLAAAITDIPGASLVLDRGFVTYSNDAKQEMLGVAPATLAARGAVSREIALEMATGALARSKADLAVAITGVAGPDGGAPDKPVGLVHFACAARGGSIRHEERRFGPLSRDEIRAKSVVQALEMLLEAARLPP